MLNILRKRDKFTSIFIICGMAVNDFNTMIENIHHSISAKDKLPILQLT